MRDSSLIFFFDFKENVTENELTECFRLSILVILVINLLIHNIEMYNLCLRNSNP